MLFAWASTIFVNRGNMKKIHKICQRITILENTPAQGTEQYCHVFMKTGVGKGGETK
jgi:hypothetical protein